MNIGTLMLIIAGIAILLAMVMKLAMLNGWFWYGFFVTLLVVGIFMGLVAVQAWVVAQLVRRIENQYRPILRRGGAFATLITLLLYFLIPTLVAAIAGLGTYFIVNYATALFLGPTA